MFTDCFDSVSTEQLLYVSSGLSLGTLKWIRHRPCLPRSWHWVEEVDIHITDSVLPCTLSLSLSLSPSLCFIFWCCPFSPSFHPTSFLLHFLSPFLSCILLPHRPSFSFNWTISNLLPCEVPAVIFQDPSEGCRVCEVLGYSIQHRPSGVTESDLEITENRPELQLKLGRGEGGRGGEWN